MTDDTRTGSCLCGAVSYSATGPLRDILYCHCSQCRKQTGHFLASTGVPSDRLKFTRDEGLAWYRASDFASRGFCRNCGSTLFWKGDDENEISIAAGTLDDSSGLVEQGHIYCADKGGYYEISGGNFQSPDGSMPGR